MTDARLLSPGEEIANSVTHGIGLLASLVGLPFLLLTAVDRGGPWQIVGCSIFAATLVGLYAASMVYHALPPSRAKQILQVVDHSAIYLLIAGSYTPFTIGVLRGMWGWTLFGLIWGLALTGIALKVTVGMRFPRVSTGLYLGMGWLAIIAARPLASAIPAAGLGWLLAGGVAYTLGVVFYLHDRPRYSHTLWHVFVLGGSACHFCAILWYATSGP